MSKWLLKVLMPATVIVGGIWLYIEDPSTSVSAPKCLFYVLTGFKCPGCGSQRMFHALLQGDFYEAMSYNVFFFLSLPVILALIWLETQRKKRPQLYMRIYSKNSVLICGVIIMFWWFLRNLLNL